MTKNPEGLIIDFGGKVSFSNDEFSYGTPVIYEDINIPVPALYGKKKYCVLVENACGTGDVEVSMRTKKIFHEFKCNLVVLKMNSSFRAARAAFRVALSLYGITAPWLESSGTLPTTHPHHKMGHNSTSVKGAGLGQRSTQPIAT